MDTPALTAPIAPSRRSYARSRLYTGISGVGTSVLMATALLALDVPVRTLSTSVSQPLPEALASLALVLMVGIAVLFPFDVLGGAVVVRGRTSVAAFLGRWIRGVVVQFAIWMLSASLLIAAARAGGTVAAIGCFVLLQFILAALRAPLARVIASFTLQPLSSRDRRIAELAGISPERIIALDTEDEGFVGGWSGIAARRLLLPAKWLSLSDDALLATLKRRRIIAESGAHLRGVLAAIAWNTLGLCLVMTLSGAALGTAAGLLTMAAGMTLWAFVGVLLLPTPSRAVVYALDQAADLESDSAALRTAIEHLDRWQDDEAARSTGVETIFHPVPARSNRIARLSREKASSGSVQALRWWHAHHVARHALWLGWGTLSPISRVVHCNVGRPALWAFLPGD